MLSKIKDTIKSKGKAFAGIVSGALVTASSTVCAFAETGTPVVTANDFNSVITGVTNQVSVATIVGVLTSIVSVCIGLVFMWWGLRKVTRMIMTAWKNGRFNP